MRDSLPGAVAPHALRPGRSVGAERDVPSNGLAPGPVHRLHRARLPADQLDTFRPLTAPLRTLLNCGRTMSLLEAVVVLDPATHGRRVAPEVLRTAADAARGQGAAGLRQAVRFADELADAPTESVLRMLVSLLPSTVQVQVRFRGVGGVDIVLDGWLVLEADGFEHHSNRADDRNE